MALPDYTHGTGFYDPSHYYSGMYPGHAFTGQPYQSYGTENPDAAYYAKLTKMGLGGLGSRAVQAQQLLPQFRRGYAAAQLNSNVNLYFPEYLDQARIGDVFNNMSYEQQGLNPSSFQGRYRWQFRPGG